MEDATPPDESEDITVEMDVATTSADAIDSTNGSTADPGASQSFEDGHRPGNGGAAEEVPDRAEPGQWDAPTFEGSTAHRRGGLTTVIIEGLFGAALLLLLAGNPFSFTVVEAMLGFALIAFGVFEAITAYRKHQKAIAFTQPVVTVVAGVVLLVWPGETLLIAGYVLAGVVAARGLLDMWAGVRRRHEDGANAWVFVRGIILTTFGAAMALFPTQSVTVVLIAGSLVAIARALLAVWFSITNRELAAAIDASDTYGVLTMWLSRREMATVDAEAVEERVFLHLGDARGHLWRFSTLMFLATVIATFGIALDSTAVVIGAMLVAPLMTPILGTAAGLINGRRHAATTSAAIVLAGSAGSIVVAWAFAAMIPDLPTVLQNAQIVSRTAPSLLDLGIALAAGAAGAYGVSRAESVDALPGVAVAIALVPPLAVVGITLHGTDFQQATGAILLFLTNLFSIVLMAGVVFIIVGYGSWVRLYQRRNRIRVSFAAVVIAIVLISIPLAFTAQRIIRQSNDLRDVSEAVETWLGPTTSLRIASVVVDGDAATIQLIGPVHPPSATTLSDDISERIGRDMTAIVRWVEETEVVGRTAGDAGTAS